MFPADNTAVVISFAPVLTLTMAVGAVLSLPDRFRRVGTVLASSSLLFFGVAFVA